MKKKLSKSAENKKKDKPEGYVFGRPSIYNKELADRICREISISTDSLQKICRENEGFPTPKTIYEWRIDHKDFGDKYDKAKRSQADLLAQEIIDISDDSSRDQMMNEKGNMVLDSEYVARSRLRVDSRKWVASKLLPKVYGDKQQIEDLQAMNSELREEMNRLRQQLDAKNKKEF